MTRPLFPFYGSKWNIARYYPVPGHRRVIEPFAGSAGYSLFYGVQDVVLVERDPVLVDLWRYLFRSTPQDIMRLPLLPNAGDRVPDDLEPGARSLIGLWINRGSAQPKFTRTAYSARTDKAQLNWSARARERVAESLQTVRSWTVIEGDFSDAPNVEATWFVDPPYQDKGRYYRVKFNEFERLAEWCEWRRGKTIVCEGSGATWLPFKPLGEFKSSTGTAKEVVWIEDDDPL